MCKIMAAFSDFVSEFGSYVKGLPNMERFNLVSVSIWFGGIGETALMLICDPSNPKMQPLVGPDVLLFLNHLSPFLY